MSNFKSNSRRFLACVLSLVMLLSCFNGVVLAAEPSDASGSSTVIIRNGEAPALLTVGTSQVTVKTGTTVETLLAQIQSKDGSAQSYQVVAADGAERAAGDAIVEGDKLIITAQNGKNSFTDALYVKDALDTTNEYWNDVTYSEIDELVNANTPVFPDVDFNITDAKYQALVEPMTEEYYSGSTKKTQIVDDYTTAIQTAIDDASNAGGGRVVIPAAEGASDANPTLYYTGSLEIKSNVNLYVDEFVVLKFVRNYSSKYFPMVLSSFEGNDVYNWASPIRAFHAENIALTGKGTIDPQADSSNWLSIKAEGYKTVSKDVLVQQWSDKAVPVEYRLVNDGYTPFPEKIPTMDIDWDDITKVTYIDTPTTDLNGNAIVPQRSLMRPCTIEPYACKNILIEGVKIVGSRMWEVHPLRCKNVLVRGLDINSHGGNNDGVDPESTCNVVIEDCRFDTGDDCIAIKSGKNRDGYARGQVGGEPSENIIVRNSNFADGHGGVTCGSECTGGVRNVFATDNEYNSVNLQQVLRFKTNSYRGGLIENIYFKDSTVIKASKALMYGETQYTAGSSQDKEGDLGPYTPALHNVYMSNIVAGSPTNSVNSSNAIYYSAYERAPMTNIKVKDVQFYGVKNQFSLNIIKNFELHNVQISTTSNVANLVTYNTTPIVLESAKLTVEGVDYDLNEADSIVLPDSVDKNNFGTVSGVISTEDAKFADNKGVVKVYLDRGIINVGNKKPIITPYNATVSKLEDGKYAFTVEVPLSDKPNYQYPYRPETEEDNMRPGNHILSIVATGEVYDQNTWNYNVRAKDGSYSTEASLNMEKASIVGDSVAMDADADITVAQLLANVKSVDGSYIIKSVTYLKSGRTTTRGNNEKVAVGDNLVISNGTESRSYAVVTAGSMSDTGLRVADNAAYVKAIDEETVYVKYGTTAAQLKSELLPLLGVAGFQTYTVADKADSDALATGDILTVTARDGSTQTYTICIYKEAEAAADTAIELAPGSKLTAVTASRVVAPKNTAAAEVVRGIQSALGGVQTYAVYANSDSYLNDLPLDGAVTDGSILEVISPDGSKKAQYVIEIKKEQVALNLMTLFSNKKLVDYGTPEGSTYPTAPAGVKGIDNGSSYFRFMDNGGTSGLADGTYFDFEITLDEGTYTASTSGGKAGTARGIWNLELIADGKSIPFGKADTSVANAVDFDGEAQYVPGGTYIAHFTCLGTSGTAKDYCMKYLNFMPDQSAEEPEVEEGYIDLTGLTEYNGVKLATGATVTKEALLKEDVKLNIVDFGAVALENRAEGDTDTYAVENTKAINAAILKAQELGGGTVVVPAGTFRVYTVELQDNVNIYLSEGAVLQAAKVGEDKYEDGSNGNYLQPEVNIYAGLQDGGHTYFANSLFYAADKRNIMVYGEGRLDGSQMNSSGKLDQVLNGNDPGNPKDRTGRITSWYGNKGIALLRCENVVLDGFDMLNCGHFAIIMEGTKNMLVDGLIVDTNRDAFNIDCGQDVTIQNSTFNSLTDDGIVFKASYGAGIMQPVHNCLVRNCIVSGYDAGSVLAGTYTTDKQVASDRCGPTARIKFGTESTCGYNTVTITDVTFKRSRGFCLESVDGSDIHDIIMVNAKMDTISSSPIYVRLGNRGRYPVTGNSTDSKLSQSNNVRLTNNGWIIPQNSEDSAYTWTEYPIQGYYPAYNTNNSVTMSNGVKVSTVNQTEPARLNKNNYFFDEAAGKYYGYKWDYENHTYVVDYDKEIAEADLVYYGDAVGFGELADGYNICVANLEVTNVDPRYPITLTGLTDSKIENVSLSNIHVTYRGGMRMQDAVEQQQLGTKWNYTQYMTAPSSQDLPWLVNTFFCKNAALLPRADWDAETESWIADPYNVPEMPEQYPEPSNFGILPAYGLYARHVDGLKLTNVTFDYEIPDERHAIVLDDCQNVTFRNVEGETEEGVEEVALVTNNYKRATSCEYVLNAPYRTTTCANIVGLDRDDVKQVTVNAPEPSTPADSLYSYPTIAQPANGFSYGENKWTYNGIDFNLPVTVYRPFFVSVDDQIVGLGDTLTLDLPARNPAAETNGKRDQAAADAALTYYADELPEGASFDAATHTLTFTPAELGEYEVTVYATDGVLPVSVTVKIAVVAHEDVCPSKDFTDAPAENHWAHAGIDYCVANGYMNGMDETSFAPAGIVTRAQLVTILYRIAGEPEVEFKGTFEDVAEGKFYSAAVEWAAANGIVNGVSETSFAPDASITREQVAAILYRYIGCPAVEGELAYRDAFRVSGYAKDAMLWAVNEGIINGVADPHKPTMLEPQSFATREQIATIIMRYLKG